MESASYAPEVVEERGISKAQLERLLDELDATDITEGISVYLKPGYDQEDLPALLPPDGRALRELIPLRPTLGQSKTGAVVFWSERSRLAVLPPFPIQRDELLEGWNTSQLRALLGVEYLLGVVLLRLGRYSVGVFRGEALIGSKTGSRYVKGRHSAGGQSQKRFQRIREKQVQEIFQKTCTVVREQFTPFENELDYILLGGEKFTLGGFLKKCDYLRGLSPKILGRVLNVRKPLHQTLEMSIDTIWQSRLLLIH